MARNLRKTTKPQPKKMSPAHALSIARSSARRAVNAGLEAATNVGQSAAGTFNALVKQGTAYEAATRKAAFAKVRKTRQSAFASARKASNAACEQAASARTRTVEAVSHLEKVFEQRVSRAISKLGMPTTKDVRALSRQVAQLQTSVDSLRRSRARARAAA